MESFHITTPFGRRSLSLVHLAAQASAQARAPHAAAHKWQVFRALCAAREPLGLSERALAVLDALLTFHPETVLTGEGLVVFPSNAQLSLRAHGMAPSTLRRHLAALVDAGLIIRRDSPNGKRYARRGQGGEIAKAFGFDLSPLVVRASEFEALAEAEREKARALRLVKERLTLARRDLAKIIAAGLESGAALPTEAGRPASWQELHAAYRRLVEDLPRFAGLDERAQCADSLADLAAFAAKALQSQAKLEKAGANESQNERHIQNSPILIKLELEPPPKEAGTEGAAKSSHTLPPLPLIVQACPDIADYTRSGIASWPDLLAAAAVARAALGVSSSAWDTARDILGERPAAVAIAAMLQRGGAISNPGGYLRELTRKAASNQFSVSPMLMALVGARNRANRGTCPLAARSTRDDRLSRNTGLEPGGPK